MTQQQPIQMPTPLTRALDQSEAVKDAVEHSADALLVISTVLKQEIPSYVQTGDVARALKKTDALESKINDTAQELALVNEMLAQEIDERAGLERELVVTKAALERAIHPTD